MLLFHITPAGTLTEIEEKSFKLERELQRLFEANLRAIMGVDLVKSECAIKNKRIDTLAFDPQANAFVIIEYKRNRNTSVFDQGITYLNLMLQHKADFIVEYNESLNRKLRRTDVDWSQSRVAFVAPDFTENQIEATDFNDLSIELWEVKRYENDTIAITPVQKSNTAESIKQLADKNKVLQSVAAELKTYTEEDLLRGKPDETTALYERFRAAILNLANGIEIKPQKWYVAFKKQRHNFVDIEIQQNALKLTVNVKQGRLDDPKHLARDVAGIGHLGNGDYSLKITDDKQLEYIMSLVRQALQP